MSTKVEIQLKPRLTFRHVILFWSDRSCGTHEIPNQQLPRSTIGNIKDRCLLIRSTCEVLGAASVITEVDHPRALLVPHQVSDLRVVYCIGLVLFGCGDPGWPYHKCLVIVELSLKWRAVKQEESPREFFIKLCERTALQLRTSNSIPVKSRTVFCIHLSLCVCTDIWIFTNNLLSTCDHKIWNMLAQNKIDRKLPCPVYCL